MKAIISSSTNAILQDNKGREYITRLLRSSSTGSRVIEISTGKKYKITLARNKKICKAR